MATLGNLYSSLKTRVSSFFGDDDEDKVKLTNPVRAQNFTPVRNYTPARNQTPLQSRAFTPVKVNTVTQNPVSSWFNNNFSSGYKNFQQQQLAQQQQQNQSRVNFTKDILSRNTPTPGPTPRVQLKTKDVRPPSFFDSTIVKEASKVGSNIADRLATGNLLDYTKPETLTGKVVQAPYNIGAYLVNSIVGQGITAPVSDVGHMIGYTLAGENLPQYNELNSGAAKLGYLLSGFINPDNKKMLGIPDAKQAGLQAAGQTLEPILNAWGGGKVLTIGKGALLSKSPILARIVESGVQAVAPGALSAGAASLNQADINDPVGKQLLEAGINTVIAVPISFAGGAILGLAGAGINSAGRKFVEQFGTDAQTILVNKDLLRRITLGQEVSPIERALFDSLNESNTSFTQAMGQEFSTAVPKEGKVWDALRKMFPDTFNPQTGEPGMQWFDANNTPLNQLDQMVDVPPVQLQAGEQVQGVTPEVQNMSKVADNALIPENPNALVPETPQSLDVPTQGNELVPVKNNELMTTNALEQTPAVKPDVNAPQIQRALAQAEPSVVPQETPETVIQDRMQQVLDDTKAAQEATQLKQIRTIEEAINGTIPEGFNIDSQVGFPQEVLQNMEQLRLALEENPKMVAELNGKTLAAMQDAGIQVQGADGEYKSVLEAAKEFQLEDLAKQEQATLQTVDGEVPEQALTDTGTQVVGREPVETAPVADLGDQQVAAGVAGTGNDELAQVTGQPQDTARTQDITGSVDQTTLGQPAYELPGRSASTDMITSRQFPGGKEVKRYPKPILVDPDGRAFVLGAHPKTTHFIDKIINRILDLSRPEDSRAIIEGVNNLLPSGEKLALPAYTQPITVATRQQAIDALSRLSPGQKIEVFNKLKDNKKVIQLISDEQVQSIQNETAELLASPLLRELDDFVANSVDSGAFKATWLGGLKNTPQQFKDWVNNRAASDIAGVRARQNFDLMDNEGIDAFHKIQQGDKSKFATQLREYFDARYQKLKDAGFELGYREDYIPQLWENPEEEVTRVLGDRLSKRPGLTFERFIDDYQEGIEKGLTPRFEKLSDLVGWYESTTNKSIADKKFFDFLNNNELIKPSDKAPRSWMTVDPDRFPTPPGQANGNYKAPADVAKIINNYLGPGNEFGRQVAGVASRMKNIVLSGGVPGTGINAHGLNLLARYTLANKNPVVGLAKGSYYLLNPKAAEANLNKSLDRMEFFIRHGMTASTEEHAFTRAMQEVEGNIFKQGLGKLSEAQKRFFEDPLFAKTVPWMKTQLADQIYEGARGKMGDTEAARMAARTVNELMGGINVDELARSKDFQNALRAVILAPDWAETNVRLGADTVKGFTTNIKDPAYGTYRKFAAAFLASYAGMNLMNKALSGHWTWENEPGNEFNLDTGTYTADGKKRYVRVYGTAADFVRIPFEVSAGILKGDVTPMFRTIKNRFSTPIGTAVALASNTDYTGQPIYGADLGLAKSIGNVTVTVSRMFLPSQVGAGIEYASGSTSGEEAMARAMELPVRYQGGAYSKTQQEVTKMIQDGGGDGQTVGEINKAIKGESLSDAQKKTIAQLAITNPTEAQKYIDTLKARRSIDDPTGNKTPLDYIKGLFGGGKDKETTPGAFVPSEDKAVRKEQISEIKARLTAGMDVSDDELNFAYFGDMLDVPTGNATEKLKAQEELYGKVSGLMNDEDLSDEQRSKLLGTLSTALGVPRSDIEYFSNASESVPVRFSLISQEVQKFKSEDDAFNFLVQLKKEVNNKAMLTSDVITELYETGYISSDMKKLLGKYRWNPVTQQVELSRSAKEGGKKKPPKLSVDIPDIKTPKFDMPSLNISFKNSNLVPLSTQGNLEPPAALRPNLVNTRTTGGGGGANLTPRISPMVTTLGGLGRI